MIELFGRPASINVRKVLWTLAELDLPCAHEPWGTEDLPLRSPAFLALNPNALVPVLRHDGRVLTESNTICRYLAARCGRTDLLPADPGERAEVERWMDWQATELNNAWRYAFMATVRRSPAHQDPAAIAAGVAEWNRHMRLLDDRLQATGGFVAGPAFTLADVPIGLSVHRWAMAPIERPALDAVARYYDRLDERPGWRQHGRNGLP